MHYRIAKSACKRREKLQALKRHQQRRQQLVSKVASARLDAGDLIDWLIDHWPDAPAFASLLVDRLLLGDPDLERTLNALRNGQGHE